MRVLDAVIRVAKGPRTRALAALGRSKAQAAEVERDRVLREAPAGRAGEVYNAAAWRPRPATLVEVKASTAVGKPISHMAKAVRGTVARRVLEAGRAPTTPGEVADLAHGEEAGCVVVHEPARAGGAWVVEVVARAQSRALLPFPPSKGSSPTAGVVSTAIRPGARGLGHEAVKPSRVAVNDNSRSSPT